MQIITGILLLVPVFVLADAGPKPTRVFDLYFNTSTPQEIKKAWILECKDKTCTSYDTLQEMGPQGIKCHQNVCVARAYGFGSYIRLVLELRDRTLTSEVLDAKAFNSTYDVIITDGALSIKETTSFLNWNSTWASFIKSALVTILIELIVAFFLFRSWNFPLNNLKYVLFANLISLPVFWFGMLNLIDNFVIAYIIGEVVVILLEIILLIYFTKNTLTLKRAFSLSLFANLASLLIEGVLHFLWYYGG